MKTALAISIAAVLAVGALLVMDQEKKPHAAPEGHKKHAEECTDTSPACLPQHEFVATDGTTWGPEDLAGKIVVVNVWATWCVPCKREIPALAAVHSEYKDKGVVMLGLLAEYGVTLDQIQKFAKETGLSYPVIFMEPEMRESLGNPKSLPSTYIYDRSGALAKSHVGEYTRETLIAEIKAADAR